MELGMMKSLCERHIGQVLLVFFSSFSEVGFSGAVARQFRMHSGQIRHESIPLGEHTETESMVTIHEQAVSVWSLEADRACLGGCDEDEQRLGMY
jgi:hypothetical protein